jgi:hypothetical protein
MIDRVEKGPVIVRGDVKGLALIFLVQTLVGAAPTQVVTPAGRIGKLQMDTSTRATIIATAGLPDAERTGSFTTSSRYKAAGDVRTGMPTATAERLLQRRVRVGCEANVYKGNLTVAFAGGHRNQKRYLTMAMSRRSGSMAARMMSASSTASRRRHFTGIERLFACGRSTSV